MNTARWEWVKTLLQQALDLAPEQRTAFLDEACSSDSALREELDSLLAAAEEVRSSFMQSPPLADEFLHGMKAGVTLEPGQTIAQRFHLVRKLGEGGMGQVWLAEQSSPVRRSVALKLIRAGMYDEAVVQRFQAERQSLAIMDHPAIAKVFDAGTTEQGQPYFVMEYVPGLPITEYCDQKKFSIQQRLELFIQACEGVQHAHQKAIIHRDLKPANILVVEVDGKPVPRIIDFGLAKATSPQFGGDDQVTRLGTFPGTPGYMSPEQADPRGGDVDTRSDVYSLGIVLYVLLTGTLPLDLRLGQTQSLDEVLRRLREEEPPRPSARASSNPASTPAFAEARGTETAQLAGLLQGDLDWITMKALEKDRARRYATPSELAADLQRYLNHEPVLARPASSTYRLQKYVRRHRVGVTAAAVLVLLLAGFALVQAVQLRRITKERDRANRERDRATRISDFMTDMFKVSDPSEARGNSITAREILDKASQDIATGLANDPELQGRLMYTMGNVYSSLGLDSRAESLLSRALETQRRTLGWENPDTLDSAASLGQSLRYQGRYAEAEKLLRETVETQRRILGPTHPDTLRSINGLGNTLYYEGDYAHAEKLLRGVFDIDREVRGPENPDTLKAMRDLSVTVRMEGHLAEAETLQRDALAMQRRVFGPEHPDTLSVMVSLANTLLLEGHYGGAERLEREILSVESKILGKEHPDTLTAMYNLTRILAQEGHSAEAETLIRDAIAVQRRVLGPEHPDVLDSLDMLAETLLQEGKKSEAEQVLRGAVAVKTRTLGPEHAATLFSMADLGETLLAEGHYAEAEQVQRKTSDARHRVLGPEQRDTLYSMSDLADVLSHEGHAVEAEQRLHQTLEVQRRVLGTDDPDTARTIYLLAAAAARTGHPDDALEQLSQAVEHGLPPNVELGIDRDPDLKTLHGDRRFQKIVADARQRAALQQKPD